MHNNKTRQKNELTNTQTVEKRKKELTLTFKKGLSSANTVFLFRRRSASYFAPSVGSFFPLPFAVPFLDFFFETKWSDLEAT